MHAVGDRLHGHVVRRDRRSDRAGLPVVERAHRVEGMGDVRSARLERATGDVERRVRVSEGDGDAALQRAANDRIGAVQLGRDRHHANVAGIEKTIEHARVRVSAASRPAKRPGDPG